MNKKEQNTQQKSVKPQNFGQKTNEHAGFHFISSLKISDPKTGKILIQKRCD